MKSIERSSSASSGTQVINFGRVDIINRSDLLVQLLDPSAIDASLLDVGKKTLESF